MIYKNLSKLSITYADFCKYAKGHIKPWENDADAKKAFDLLCTPEYLIPMLVYSDTGLPAMAAVILKLQDALSQSKTFIIDKSQNPVQGKTGKSSTNTSSYRVHQAIGMMIKYIMENYGYKPSKTGLAKGTYIWKMMEESEISNSSVYSADRGNNNVLVLL